MSNSPRPIQVT